MVQHKYNPTPIAAKKGEIKPKEKGLSKSEHKKVFTDAIYIKCYAILLEVHRNILDNIYEREKNIYLYENNNKIITFMEVLL